MLLKNNDLSNKVPPNIAFRVENFLLQYKDDSFFDSIGNFVVGKLLRAEENKKVSNMLYKILRYTDYTADLIVLEENLSVVEDRLQNFPFNEILTINELDDIVLMLNTGRAAYYVDNKERAEKVNHKYAYNIERINELIGG